MTLSADSSSPASSIPVPLIDMRRQFAALEEPILAALARVCRSGQYILGPECQALETALARLAGTEHAVACASGSDALLLAMMASGIGPDDEVLVPSYTFFATASAAWRLGARPVFVDIDPATFNLDHRLLAERITPATKAVVPVHLFGQCAEMEPIRRLAETRGLWVIEDAAQAIGAEYQGRPAGSLGDMACFSFYPTKNLGGLGDGGLLTTPRGDLARRLRLLSTHGMEPRYYHQLVGINSRLDALQAAVLNVKLPHLETWSAARARHAARYAELFAHWRLDEVLGLPATAPGRRHVWNQYVVRVPDGRRDALREYLRGRQIGTEVYYPVALHEQPCFRALGYSRGMLPETEKAARETLALPVFPELTAGEQETVVRAIAEYFGTAPRPAATIGTTSSTGTSSPANSVPGPKFLRHAGSRAEA